LFEIELKAWVDDPASVREKAGALAKFTADFEKQDVYWFLASPLETQSAAPVSGVRIRKESFTANGKAPETLSLVTYKTKEVRAGVEVNDEKEFVVAAPPGAAIDASLNAFEGLLGRLGLKPGISKKKQGSVWTYGDAGRDISIELSNVDRLGVFVELEILAGNNEPETVSRARARLMALLQLIGIGEDKIETRYYTEMLAAFNADNQGH
jgi:adenylate cyclase class 2